jgi:hypothetical protein
MREEHAATLASASNLASSLSRQGKHAEAERIHREVLGVRRRVLGAEHPDTLTSENNLAVSLSYQGRHAEAAEMLTATVESKRRVLGSAHPDTLATARSLEVVQANAAGARRRATRGSADCVIQSLCALRSTV